MYFVPHEGADEELLYLVVFDRIELRLFLVSHRVLECVITPDECRRVRRAPVPAPKTTRKEHVVCDVLMDGVVFGLVRDAICRCFDSMLAVTVATKVTSLCDAIVQLRFALSSVQANRVRSAIIRHMQVIYNKRVVFPVCPYDIANCMEYMKNAPFKRRLNIFGSPMRNIEGNARYLYRSPKNIMELELFRHVPCDDDGNIVRCIIGMQRALYCVSSERRG